MKFLLSLIISLNVLALDDFDLYRYGPTAILEPERTGFVLKLIIYETNSELQTSFEEFSGRKEDIRAFTQTLPGDDMCYVHIVKAELWDNREALAILGHEVYHCTFATHIGLEKLNEHEEQAIVDEEAKLKEQDKKLELANLEEECNNNTEFNYIAGCAELKNRR